MELRRYNLLLSAASRWVAAAAVLFLLGARGAEPAVPDRWLLVFDTSVSMKKCLPETEAVIRKFFSTGADGQLQTGDTVAIWTVNQQVSGQFTTYTWAPERATTVVSNLVAHLERQPYPASSRLESLQAPLNRVVAISHRLTVVLFTDGRSAISGTPYDDGVNQALRDAAGDSRKTPHLLVVVLRSQQGKFTGCSVSYPPGEINLPPFPSLPPPPPVTNAPALTAPKPASASAVPSLVLTGKPAGTNASPAASEPANIVVTGTKPPAATNPVAVVTNPAVVATNPAVVVTNPVVYATNPAPSATNPILASTNRAVAVTNPAVAVAVTNPPASRSPVALAPAVTTANQAVATAVINPLAAPAPEEPGRPAGILMMAVAGLAAVALAVAVLVVRARRRPQSSLISSSLQDDLRRK